MGGVRVQLSEARVHVGVAAAGARPHIRNVAGHAVPLEVGVILFSEALLSVGCSPLLFERGQYESGKRDVGGVVWDRVENGRQARRHMSRCSCPATDMGQRLTALARSAVLKGPLRSPWKLVRTS